MPDSQPNRRKKAEPRSRSAHQPTPRKHPEHYKPARQVGRPATGARPAASRRPATGSRPATGAHRAAAGRRPATGARAATGHRPAAGSRPSTGAHRATSRRPATGSTPVAGTRRPTTSHRLEKPSKLALLRHRVSALFKPQRKTPSAPRTPKTAQGTASTTTSARLGTIIGVIIVVAIIVALLMYALVVRTLSDKQGQNLPTGIRVANEAVPFTTADVGACLNWTVSPSGEISDFEPARCSNTHRFEISLRTDLSLYPNQEFGLNASLPTTQRQAELRVELCERPTLNYLQGRYDPSGKFSIAPILPSPRDWAEGDRTMLCGLQVTDDEGSPVATKGAAAQVDQAVVYQPGQCVSYADPNHPKMVDCAQPHAMEATKVVDLAQHFPKGMPTITEQDSALKKICTQAAFDYLGSEEKLYQSTLTPFWTTLPPRRWNLGSHSVNCGLIAPTESDSFAALAGQAKEKFTINGQPPVPPPNRTPLVTEEQNAKTGQEPGQEVSPSPAGNAG